jgi:hypothetical protein
MGQNFKGVFYTQDINHLKTILMTWNDRLRILNKNEIKKNAIILK